MQQSLSHGFAVPAPFTQGSLWVPRRAGVPAAFGAKPLSQLRCQLPFQGSHLPPAGRGSLPLFMPVGGELGEGFDLVEDVVVDVGAAEEGEF